MTEVKIPKESWVVVCNGAKAQFFCNEGTVNLVRLKSVDSFSQVMPPSRESGSDRPGRVHQAFGTARSAVENPDWHEVDETAFLARVAGRLEQAVREREVRNVILVAPPKALGILRKQLSAGAKTAVSVEIAKDLAQFTAAEVGRHLSA